MTSPFTGIRSAILEFKNFKASGWLLFSICAVGLIPLIYAGLFLLAFLDPYGNLVQVPAAVVNLDQGAEIDGEDRNIGQELCDSLIEKNEEREEGQATGYNWKFVSSTAEADEGLRDATYYMEIVIPENFTENVASADSKDPQKAELQVYLNPSTNLIATTVGQSMVTKIKYELTNKITESYFDTIFVSISDASDMLVEAVDGSKELSDGLDTAYDGSSTLTSGLGKLQDGSATLTEGIETAEDGSSSLSDGLNQLEAGSSTLTDKLGDAQEGSSKITDGLEAASSGSDQLKNGIKSAKDGSSTITKGLKSANSGSEQLASGLQQAQEGSDTITTNLGTLAEGAESVDEGVAQVSDGLGELDLGIKTSQLSTKALSTLLNGIASALTSYQKSGNVTYLATAVTLSGLVKTANATIGDDMYTYVTDLTSALSKYETAKTASTKKQKAMDSAKDAMTAAYKSVATSQSGLETDAGQLSDDLTTLGSAASDFQTAYDQMSSGTVGPETVIAAGGSLAKAAASVVAGADSGSGVATLTDLSKFQKALQSYQSAADDYQTAAAEYQTAATAEAEAAAAVSEAKGVCTGYLKGLSNMSSVTSSATETMADAVDQLYTAVSGDLKSGTSQVASGAAQLQAGSQTLTDSLGTAATGAASLNEGIIQLYDGSGTLTLGLGSAYTGISSLSSGLKTAKDGSATLTSGLSAAQEGSGTITENLGTAADGSQSLTEGLETAAEGSGTITEKLGTAKKGSKKLTDGLETAADGSETLHDGLADGQETMDESTENSDAKVEMMHEPVVANGSQGTGETITSVKNYGTGFAPYFIGLGMWVGCLMVTFLIRTLNSRLLMSRASSLSAVLSSYIPMAAIAIAQVLILLLFIQFVLGFNVNYVPQYYLFGILVAMTFMAIIQFFRAALGTAGMVVIVVLLMIQLCTAAGTFPIEAELPIFNILNPLLPMTYVVQGFRMAMCGLSADLMVHSTIVLIGFLVGFLVLTTLWAMYRRRATMNVLYPKIQMVH